jgi:hypothetical protein
LRGWTCAPPPGRGPSGSPRTDSGAWMRARRGWRPRRTLHPSHWSHQSGTRRVRTLKRTGRPPERARGREFRGGASTASLTRPYMVNLELVNEKPAISREPDWISSRAARRGVDRATKRSVRAQWADGLPAGSVAPARSRSLEAAGVKLRRIARVGPPAPNRLCSGAPIASGFTRLPDSVRNRAIRVPALRGIPDPEVHRPGAKDLEGGPRHRAPHADERVRLSKPTAQITRDAELPQRRDGLRRQPSGTLFSHGARDDGPQWQRLDPGGQLGAGGVVGKSLEHLRIDDVPGRVDRHQKVAAPIPDACPPPGEGASRPPHCQGIAGPGSGVAAER